MTYKTTKTEFLARVEKLIPESLAATSIVSEIDDLYPEMHIPQSADLVCALDSHAEIIDAVRALTDAQIIEYIASFVPDVIVSECTHDQPELVVREIADMTQQTADELMKFVRTIDPTDSHIAARIRDAIRDNIENVTV